MKSSIILAIFCLTLSSCSTVNTVALKENRVSKINFFKGTPPKKGENRVYHQALTRGYLITQNNCLYLTKNKNTDKELILLFWPWDFSLKETKHGVHILNSSHKVFAKVGGYYSFGGSGGNFNQNSYKLLNKYKICVNENVKGSWGVSPGNPTRPMSKTRKMLRKFMQ